MSDRVFKTFLCTLVIIAGVCCFAAEQVKPKYIFLFIGDGMSFPQRMAAAEYCKQAGLAPLAINAMKYHAVTTTNSANSFITDSAASGTAIACGTKTNNGMIGVDPQGKPLVSVAKAAKKAGRKVGIITSVTINHATPASFYANNISRGNYYQIALDMVNSGFDYFGGGGASKFDNKKDKKYCGNIYELAEKAGYFVSLEGKKFNEINPSMKKVMSFGAVGALPYAIDSKEGDLRLADFVRQAITQLDNPNGFFIMAEGGKIDWMCHSNDAGTTIKEVIDFDKAVSVALEFAKKHPSETLVVVTGDHETGGLTLGFAGTAYKSFIKRISLQRCSRDKFNHKLRELSQKNELTFEVAKKLAAENFGFEFVAGGKAKKLTMQLSAAEEKALKKAYSVQFPGNKNRKDARGVYDSTFVSAVIRLFNNKASLAWTSGAHTALPVNTTADGVGAENFTNMIDNTDISKKLKELL